MKKHFLLLMLMALLPLAGWAQIDLSDGWAISLAPASPATYNGTTQKPTVKLVKDGESDITSGFDIDWGAGNWTSAGNYTITVTGDLTNTYDELTKPTVKYYILKATASISTDPAAAVSLTYTGTAQALVTAGEVDAFGSDQPVIEYIVSATTPAEDATGWSEDIPNGIEAGTYNVWYRVPGTDNYNGVGTCESPISVTISGTSVSVTAPEAVEGLVYDGTAKTLISAATITTEGAKGTLYYKVGEEDWSTSLPKGTNAGSYSVKYKFEGTDGYESTAEQTVSASIAKATPVITAATAAEGLIYNGEARALLNAAATATLNAPVVYSINSAASVEFENVKGTNADDYSVVAKVEESANFNAVMAEAIVVNIAKKNALVPTAKANLVYNAEAQILINAGEAGAVKYQLDGGDWKDDITTIVGTNAGSYTVKYKVENTNYVKITATSIEGVKIAQAPITIKVGDLTKTFDNTATIREAQGSDYTFLSSVDGYTTGALAFETVDKKNAGTYNGVITTTQAKFEALGGTNANYKINVVPGNLTINPQPIYVEAKNQTALTTTMDAPLTLDNLYEVKDTIVGAPVAWTTKPVLKSDAPTPLIPGSYTLSFEEGTLVAEGNYVMSAENPYKIADGEVYQVNAAAGSGLVITVAAGLTKVYGEDDPDWLSNPVKGKHYYMTGDVAGDNITVTFSRAEGEDAGPYKLEATAVSENPGWYAARTEYIQGTFTITPKELVATVDKQYVTVGATELPNPDGWSVEGLIDGDDIEDLNGTLAMSSTASETTEGTITLSIDNDNYTLKDGTNVGQLIVISASTLVLNTADNTLKTKIETAEGSSMNISFESKAMKAKEWYAMVLPFATTPAELVGKLGTYVVVNVFDNAVLNEKEGKQIVTSSFKLEMDTIPAGTPFLIKPAVAVNWSGKTFANKVISSEISDVQNEETGKDKAIFTGTYESGLSVKWGYELDGTTVNSDKKYQWLADTDYQSSNGYVNNWLNCKSNAHELKPMEAYLILTTEADGARVFVEDIENGTTSIKSLSADQVNGLNINAAEGWYNLNGVKIDVPTEKGIYINNGKTVVIK